MKTRPANDGQLWTRDELVLAFDLYCRIPFQQTKATNPKVKDLAILLRRTPASVARKLGNFGAFDPQLAAKNISGLTHGSKLDKAIWNEFHADWSGLVTLANELKQARETSATQPEEIALPEGPSERLVTAKQRVHQSFFREAVLSSYSSKCCITRLPITQCLIAGHIIPWNVSESRRADPTNGICLSATFDRLFDCGLMTIDQNLMIVMSQSILSSDDTSVRSKLTNLHGKPIMAPARFAPDLVCLRWHQEHIFKTR